MRRTAADFRREAPKEPYELAVGTGNKKRWIKPRPYSDMTAPQRIELARINDTWAKANGFPRTPSGVSEMSPDVFILRMRFGALEARKPTDDDPRAFAPKDSRDYDAFFAEYYSVLPIADVGRVMDEVDEHYDPEPATPQEKAAAAGSALLAQCTALLETGDVDSPKVKELLAQIAEVAEQASVAAGKSTVAAGD